jgi:hypothetical protein
MSSALTRFSQSMTAPPRHPTKAYWRRRELRLPSTPGRSWVRTRRSSRLERVNEIYAVAPRLHDLATRGAVHFSLIGRGSQCAHSTPRGPTRLSLASPCCASSHPRPPPTLTASICACPQRSVCLCLLASVVRLRSSVIAAPTFWDNKVQEASASTVVRPGRSLPSPPYCLTFAPLCSCRSSVMASTVVFSASPSHTHGAYTRTKIDSEASSLFDSVTGIPHPGIAPHNPHRKSHAKKRPEGHIRRPRNAWIFFRSDYVYLQGVKPCSLSLLGTGYLIKPHTETWKWRAQPDGADQSCVGHVAKHDARAKGTMGRARAPSQGGPRTETSGMVVQASAARPRLPC